MHARWKGESTTEIDETRNGSNEQNRISGGSWKRKNLHRLKNKEEKKNRNAHKSNAFR